MREHHPRRRLDAIIRYVPHEFSERIWRLWRRCIFGALLLIVDTRKVSNLKKHDMAW